MKMRRTALLSQLIDVVAEAALSKEVSFIVLYIRNHHWAMQVMIIGYYDSSFLKDFDPS